MVDELTPQIPPASPQEYYEPAPRKKPIVLGLVAVVLVVILGVGIFWWVKFKRPGAPTPLPKVMERIENGRAKCQNAVNPDKCLNELTLDEAVSGRQVEACEKVEDAELLDGCFDAIAREVRDEAICNRIAGSAARDDCAGAILFAKAKAGREVAACSGIISLKWRNSCFLYIFESEGTVAFCESLPELKEECLSIVLTREAVLAANMSLCAGISSEENRRVCEELAEEAKQTRDASLASDDDDGDKLSNRDEVRYGTDPKNPDTDGDGFKDGDEVRAGYNPKGPGRLP